MESGPRKIAEALVSWLLPPTCREEVLGGMRERNQSSAQFLVEARYTIPSDIYSRIRPATDAVLTLMEAVSMYTAFVVSARWSAPQLLLSEYGFARLAIPAAISLLAIILADAYSDPKKRSPLKPIFGPTFGLTLSYAVELNHSLSIQASVLAWGGALSLLLVSTLRLIFPPVAGRPQVVNLPAFWQKLELLPPSFSLKGALLPCALLLVIVLCLLMLRS